MGGKDAPDTPSVGDYMDIARQQAELGKELIREQTTANRPNQYTPYGSSVWEDLGNNRWQQTVTLPDIQQAALESQQRTGLGRSEMAEGLVGRAGQELAAPIQWEAMQANEVGTGADARQAAEDALYGRTTSRLDPMWQQREQATYNQLWNQGLRPGDEAWNAAMGNLGRERTDAYQTAAREATIYGGQEAERQFGMDFKRRQQAIAEELQRRGASLNEINAALTGQQVAAPGMPTFSRAGTSAPPDLLRAMGMGYQSELDRYNAENMQDQGLWSGITGLASAGAAWAPFAFSDRRLKTRVQLIGHTLGRQSVYSYHMFGQQMIGVMADESPPNAVIEHPSGYLMVDYSRIV